MCTLLHKNVYVLIYTYYSVYPPFYVCFFQIYISFLFNVYVYAVLRVYMPYMMFTMYNEAPLLVKNGLN